MAGFKHNKFRQRPVEMHSSVCDNCGKNCEVPFRPTSGKPVFCSNCFERREGSDSRRSESPRKMFEAVCDNCGKNCRIPFRPTGGRPVYCSDCFEKGNNEPLNNDRDNRESRNAEQPQFQAELKAINIKLDEILELLTSAAGDMETLEEIAIEEAPVIEKKKKSSKKTESLIQE